MAPVTEIAILPIASTSTLTDTSTKEGEVWATSEETMRAANGAQSLYWSRWVENKEMVNLMINWDSIERHMDFRASPGFAAFEKKVISLTNSPPSMFHAHLTPHPPTKAFEAPVVEVITIYFHAAITETEKQTYYQNFKNFMEQMIVDANGLVAEAHGWAVEELEKDGKKQKAFMCFIGWDSVDMHMKHRETKSFKECIHLLRDGSEATEMHHVKFADPTSG